MCSDIADILLLESPTSDSPPASPFSNQNTTAAAASRRNVRFHETRMEISIESLAALNEEEKSKLWFTEQEIESFKVEARALCERIKLGIVTANEETNSTRGLELRLSSDRQRRKFMILQAIIKAQKRYKEPKQLCNIARKCSVWSKAVAAIVAQRDYCDLYDPARSASVRAFPTLEEYPLPFKSRDPCTIPVKRPTSPVPHQRRVRPRPTPFAAPC